MVAAIEKLNWLVLGGSGQLGRAMGMKLAAQGVPYFLLDRAELDVTNQIAVEKSILFHKPDVVLNAAAWTNVESAELDYSGALNVNANGPRNLAKACAASGAQFIHLSTDYVFSGTRETPWQENSRKNPISNYGRSKSLGEDFVLETYPKGSIIVRTSWLYSEWGKNFVKTMARIALKESGEVRVVCDQIGRPTSAIDLATQLYLMVGVGVEPGTYHASNSGQCSWYEFAKELFLLLNCDVDRVKPILSAEHSSKVRRPEYGVMSFGALEKQGFKPMQNWRDALRDYLPSIANSIK